MNYYKRFRLFFMFHKAKVLIGAAVVLIVFLAIWGMASLESFYRNMTLAQAPLQMLMMAINAVIFVYMYTVVLRGGFTKMDKKKIKGQQVNIKFSDVIGIDEAKEEAWEVVQLVKDHAKIKQIGGKIIKGILMIGPPGCGKTYLAKAIATEAGLPFLSMAASEFNEVFVGVGSARIRQLFKQARTYAYGYGGCVIFIDELDVIGQNRTFNLYGGAEKNATQNQLLAEMDGMASINDNVIIIGATNAPEDALDPALLRPGRFDRKVYINAPGLEGREQLFEFYLSKVKCDKSIDQKVLAKKAVGKSPAQIEAIVKEAALIATRNKKEQVSYKEISEAIERIELGVKVKRNMAEKERIMTAYHEAGHLITGYILHPINDVFKASIIPRNSTLGVVHYQPSQEFVCDDKPKVLADIKCSLAGYASERIQFGVTTNGVSGDFKAAMHRAYTMVWKLGMGRSGLVGDYTMIPQEHISDELKKKLNDETTQVLDECLKEVDALLRQKKNVLDRFANELLEKEELDFDEIERIFAEYGIKNPRSVVTDDKYMPRSIPQKELSEESKPVDDATR
jgi:cell division protease FtsH